MANQSSLRVIVTTKRVWTILSVDEGGKRSHYDLEAGRHEMERIRCPTGHNCDWYVLVGTKIGGAVGWWHDLTNEDETSEFHITIESA